MGRSGIFAAWVTIGVLCGMGWAQEPTGRAAGAGGAAAASAPASAKATGPASANMFAHTQALASTTGPAETSPAILLEKGIYTEETVGDLDAAINVYQQVIDQAKTSRKYAAQAQYRLAMCYAKKKESAAALHALQTLVTEFQDQKDLVIQAAKKIGEVRDAMPDAEIAQIVGEVVTSISTKADGDKQIQPLLQSLRELKEPAVVKALTAYFGSDKATVRRAAIYVIWKGEFADASAAVSDLITLCSHEEDVTRGMAALALGGVKANKAFDKITQMAVGDKSSYARRCAAYALGLMGNPQAKAILDEALKDSDPQVRNNAEAALTMLTKKPSASSPHVIKTTPTVFANDIDPSLNKITVTFDQKMTNGNWSWVQRYKDKFPQRNGDVAFDAELTTCAMPVKLEPGKVYWIEFNSPPYDSFTSADGKKAKRYAMIFATKSADGKPTPLPDDLVQQAKAINAASSELADTAQAALKGKLINWVEDYFSKNYRDITARKTLAWGQPSQEPGGNVSITYKYAATIWNKDKLIIEQKFTFSPEGKFVSAETLEKGPASEPAAGMKSPPVITARTITAEDRKDAENLSAEGWRLWNEQKLPEAEAKFQAAVAKDPTAANGWNGLGWSQLNQDKKLNAKDAFEKAIAIEPKHPAALNGLGHLAKGEGKTDQAIEYWQKAVAGAPTATAALAGLASTYIELGQYDKAIDAYQQWLKAEPDNTDAKAGLKKAQEAAEAIKAAGPAAEEWLKLVDSGKYGESWDVGSASMKAAVTRQQWVDTVKPVRPPLGKVGSRKLQSSEFATTFPGMPDGQYVTLKYESSFENKKQAIETVILEKDNDGEWRMAGYFIK